MIQPMHLALWEKIQSFSLDQPGAAIPFSVKLAREESWSGPFTQRAITEYKKFIFLCCVSPSGAAPSTIVDEVWHLHLTYTQSYWIDFCRNTLGKDIHHHPSAGGESEDGRHRDWYRETLQLYKNIFGTEAPADIWPAPRIPTIPTVQTLPTVQPGIAPAEDNIPPMPAETAFLKEGTLIAWLVLILAAPFLFSRVQYDRLNPFNLKGAEFLVWFPVFGICLLIAQVLLKRQRYQSSASLTSDHFPAQINAFQAAGFFYGKHRAVQTAIYDLVDRGWLEVSGEENFIVHSHKYIPYPTETNPLVPYFARRIDGEVWTYPDILKEWYKQEEFSTPALTAIEKWAFGAEPVWLYSCMLIFFIVGFARIIQGLINHRPVGFLLLEMLVLGIAIVLAGRSYTRAGMMYSTARGLYTGHDSNTILSRFAMQGSSAIDGLATGLLLGSIFDAYTPARYRNNISDTGSKWTSGDNSSSSCGSNSCSSGSSCGSSSSCGGGGCGGCSGGGD